MTSVLLANVLTNSFLVVVIYMNRALGQVLSLVGAGIIIALFLSILSWLINQSELNYLQKRNTISIYYLVICIAIFGMATSYGEGSVFRVHYLRAFNLFDIVIGGGMFGLVMGVSILFDNPQQNKMSNLKTIIFRIMSFIPFLAFMVIFYMPTDGWLFVASITASRIVFSLLFNHRNSFIEHNIYLLSLFSITFLVIILPLTAFFSG